MAEYFFSQSPYVYAKNNPVRFIDFLGLSAADSEEVVNKLNSKNKNQSDIPVTDITLKEVVCRPSFWLRVKIRVKSWFKSSNQNTSRKPQNYEEYEVDDGIDMFNLQFFPGESGENDVLSRDHSDWNKIFKHRKSVTNDEEPDNYVELTSDEKIVKETAGNNKELIEGEVERRSGKIERDNYSQGQESDSIVTTYMIHDSDDPKERIYQDRKELRGTDKGRWLGKPFKKK